MMNNYRVNFVDIFHGICVTNKVFMKSLYITWKCLNISEKVRHKILHKILKV